MAHPSPNQIVDIVLGRQQVYALDIDSQIREASNRLTARALFELLAHLDDKSPDFGSDISSVLSGFFGVESKEVVGVIGFATNEIQSAAPPDNAEQPNNPSEYYLRLVFSDEQAAFYQFPLFPDLNADYVLGASRKRAGAVQHLHITLSSPQALQTFIESCRTNPHFVRVEESTADEFKRAPSNAI